MPTRFSHRSSRAGRVGYRRRPRHCPGRDSRHSGGWPRLGRAQRCDRVRPGVGGNGNDSLFGSNGNDTLIGEAGNDLFLFASGDGIDEMLGLGPADVIEIHRLIGLPPAIITNTGGRFWQIDYGSSDSLSVRADTGVDLVPGSNVVIVDDL